jgi:hypothetical protein
MFFLKRKILIPIVLFILLILAAWKGKVLDLCPGISEDEFVKVYAELSLTSEQYRADPIQLNTEREKILEKYKVTEKELKAFIEKTQKDGERWASIWEKIVERLKELQKEEYKK